MSNPPNSFRDFKSCPNGLDRIHQACERGIFSEQGVYNNAAYEADPEFYAKWREYFAVVSQCTGLVSVTYEECPNLEIVLGAGLGYLTTIQGIMIFVLVLLIYFCEDDDDDQAREQSDDSFKNKNLSDRAKKALQKTQNALG